MPIVRVWCPEFSEEKQHSSKLLLVCLVWLSGWGEKKIKLTFKNQISNKNMEFLASQKRSEDPVTMVPLAAVSWNGVISGLP